MSIKPYKSEFRDGRSANPPIPPGGRRVYQITHVIAQAWPAWVEGSQLRAEDDEHVSTIMRFHWPQDLLKFECG